MVAFGAELTGPELTVADDQGFWAGEPGDLRLVAREGEPAPGLPGLTFSIPSGAANEAGDVFMHADLLGPGVDHTNRATIWTDRSGTLQLVLREGDPAPFTENGTVIGGGISFGTTRQNENSNIAVAAKLAGPSVDGFNDEILYAEHNGVIRKILREGEAAPEAGSGPGSGPTITFGGSSSQLNVLLSSFNGNDHVAFSIRLGGAIPTTSAIYSDRTGTLAPVAIEDQPAPGTSFNYSFFGTSRLNNLDQVAFVVAYPDDDGNIFTPPPFGVFSDVGGTIAPTVAPGDTTLEGDTIRSARLEDFNNAGQILLNLAIESAAFRSGLWLRDTDGAIHRIAAVGDTFDFTGDGTDVREIIRVVSGSLNDAGQVALRLDFSDNSSAHFVGSLCTGNTTDVGAFVTALLAANPDATTTCRNDANQDGQVNAEDIQPFIDQLFGG
jgi:hypothetical protein